MEETNKSIRDNETRVLSDFLPPLQSMSIEHMKYMNL